eukprot:SAG31_NODE_18300_length_641_cov_0.760148_1_plen_207_part_01
MVEAAIEPWPFSRGPCPIHGKMMAPNYAPPTARWQAWRRTQGQTSSPSVSPSSVKTLEFPVSAEAVLDALAKDGAIVLHGLLSETLRRRIAAALGEEGDFVRALGGDSSNLLAEPFIMQICDAVLASQIMRMDAAELASRAVVGPGNFTANTPILQLPWELDYVGAAGEVVSPPAGRACPAIPSLKTLDTHLDVVWQTSQTACSPAG